MSLLFPTASSSAAQASKNLQQTQQQLRQGGGSGGNSLGPHSCNSPLGVDCHAELLLQQRPKLGDEPSAASHYVDPYTGDVLVRSPCDAAAAVRHGSPQDRNGRDDDDNARGGSGDADTNTDPYNLSPPPSTPSLLTSAPSSCPSAYERTVSSTSSLQHATGGNGAGLLLLSAPSGSSASVGNRTPHFRLRGDSHGSNASSCHLLSSPQQKQQQQQQQSRHQNAAYSSNSQNDNANSIPAGSLPAPVAGARTHGLLSPSAMLAAMHPSQQQQQQSPPFRYAHSYNSGSGSTANSASSAPSSHRTSTPSSYRHNGSADDHPNSFRPDLLSGYQQQQQHSAPPPQLLLSSGAPTPMQQQPQQDGHSKSSGAVPPSPAASLNGGAACYYPIFQQQQQQQQFYAAAVPAPPPVVRRHMTPMGTPITASLSPAELLQHRHFLHHQRTQVTAYAHELLHKFILQHSNVAQSVSRGDHKAMVKILIAEAYRNDPQRRANVGRWRRVMSEAMREIDSKNAVLMSIAPDPYHGVLAKLSSMLLHNAYAGAQYWQYRYWEEEMHRRRAAQQAVLAKLRGRLFLDDPMPPPLFCPSGMEHTDAMHLHHHLHGYY